MLIAQVWRSNRARAGGRFNWWFWWVYPLLLPLCVTWDVLGWLERAITPRAHRDPPADR